MRDEATLDLAKLDSEEVSMAIRDQIDCENRWLRLSRVTSPRKVSLRRSARRAVVGLIERPTRPAPPSPPSRSDAASRLSARRRQQ